MKRFRKGIIFLKGGMLIEKGTIQELSQKPKSQYVKTIFKELFNTAHNIIDILQKS